MPSKKPSKADSFDEWLKTEPRRSRVCQTCADGGKPIELAARWAAAAASRATETSIKQLHDHLVEKCAYRWSLAALSQHIRGCLGYLSRAR